MSTQMRPRTVRLPGEVTMILPRPVIVMMLSSPAPADSRFQYPPIVRKPVSGSMPTWRSARFAATSWYHCAECSSALTPRASGSPAIMSIVCESFTDFRHCQSAPHA